MDSDVKQEIIEIKKATIIQKVFRGFLYRYHVSQKSYEHHCATLIQNFWRKIMIAHRYDRIKEILALKIIERNILAFNQKLNGKKHMDNYKRFDSILTYYPARSRQAVSPTKISPIKVVTSPKIIQPKNTKISKAKSVTKIPPAKPIINAPHPKTNQNQELPIVLPPNPPNFSPSNLNPNVNPLAASVMNKTTLEIRKLQSKSDINQKLSKSMKSLSSFSTISQVPTTNIETQKIIESLKPPTKKILIDLPPPWHSKDSRFYSQPQQDELLFKQKGDLAWVKSDLIPPIMKLAEKGMTDTDELLERNERFINRIVYKPFYWLCLRTSDGVNLKHPLDLKFIGSTGSFAAASIHGFCLGYVQKFTENSIFLYDLFRLGIPFFDVAINPLNGIIYCIDATWKVHLINGRRSSISVDLYKYVPIKTPKRRKIINFDKMGMLWVNLFPQKGNLFCLDPLTLEITIIIQLEVVSSRFKMIRSIAGIIPLNFNSTPVGFAAIFNDNPDIMIFNVDFSESRLFKHSAFSSIPLIRQENHTLFVWRGSIIYVYDIKETINKISLLGKIEVFQYFQNPLNLFMGDIKNTLNSTRMGFENLHTTSRSLSSVSSAYKRNDSNFSIVDVCCTQEPPLMYVSCNDANLHVFLLKPTSFSLNLINCKLSFMEQNLARKLFREPKFTESRKLFSEMAVKRFPIAPVHIDSFSVGKSLSVVLGIFDSGTISSMWVFNDAQPVKCKDFDDFVFWEPLQSSHPRSLEAFHSSPLFKNKAAHDFIGELKNFREFDENANTLILKSSFMSPIKEKPLQFHDLILKIKTRSLFPFFPPSYDANGPSKVSIYECFHFLYRSSVLSSPISRFSNFIKRYMPSELLCQNTTSESAAFNLTLPAAGDPSSIYKAIITYSFTPEQIDKMVQDMNPLQNLRKILSKYTLSSIPTYDSSADTQRLWLYAFKRDKLSYRLARLNAMQDEIKHEQMNRIQTRLDKQFVSHLLRKMLPISIPVIPKVLPHHSISRLKFSSQPHRNPLIEVTRYFSLIEKSAVKVLYSSEKEEKLKFRQILLSSSFFPSSQNIDENADPRKSSFFEKSPPRVVSSSIFKLSPSELAILSNNPDAEKTTALIKTLPTSRTKSKNNKSTLLSRTKSSISKSINQKIKNQTLKNTEEEQKHVKEQKENTELKTNNKIKLTNIVNQIVDDKNDKEEEEEVEKPKPIDGIRIHFENLAKLANEISTSKIYDISDINEGGTCITFTEDPKSLPLSYYIKVHSFLGGSKELLETLQYIMSRVLSILYIMHHEHTILRTLCENNILINVSTNNVSLSSIFDGQDLKSKISIPINDLFLTHFGEFQSPIQNPYMPPEYFHELPSKYTTAFDVWQFGILVLYLISGHLPPSYGSVMEHACQMQRLEKTADGIYPRPQFFYDWLKGSRILPMSANCVGEKDECILTTEGKPENASILHLDQYHLLPFFGSKGSYDESRIYLEVIAACLQVDPEKRPSIEQLLMTVPFNTSASLPSGDDTFFKTPNSSAFLGQFVIPSIGMLSQYNPNSIYNYSYRLNDPEIIYQQFLWQQSPSYFDCQSFEFSLGVVTALLFVDETFDEDRPYVFPIDIRSNERIVTELLRMKIFDTFVAYILKCLLNSLSPQEVVSICNANIISFSESEDINKKNFQLLLNFYMRFVSAVDRGQGSLVSRTTEIIMSLLSLYSANPYLPHSSHNIISLETEFYDLKSSDSAALYLFTHHMVHGLIRYVFSQSTIYSAFIRTEEHSEQYYDQFLGFSDAVANLANAMCHAVDKQRANASRMVAAIWQSNPTPSLVRLFIDFKVPQKIIYCMHSPNARIDAALFIESALKAAHARLFDPIFQILAACVLVPISYENCSTIIKLPSPPEAIKAPYAAFSKRLISTNKSIVYQLIASDLFWAISDFSKDQNYRDVLADLNSFAPNLAFSFIMASNTYSRSLSSIGLTVSPCIDNRSFDNILELSETLSLSRSLSQFFILNNAKAENNLLVPFIHQALKIMFREAESISKYIDTQTIRETKLEQTQSKPAFMKAQSKEKEASLVASQSMITELCSILIDLYSYLCQLWKQNDQNLKGSDELVKYLIERIQDPVPVCKVILHPSSNIQHMLAELVSITYKELPKSNQIRKRFDVVLDNVKSFFERDIAFIKHCSEKDMVKMQLLPRYAEERKIRKTFFDLVISEQNRNWKELLTYVICNMIEESLIMNNESRGAIERGLECPIRSEGITMITGLLKKSMDYHNQNMQIYKEAKKVIETVFIKNKIVEKEEKMLKTVEHFSKILESISLFSLIIESKTFQDEKLHSKCYILLSALKERYEKDAPSHSSIETTEKIGEQSKSIKYGEKGVFHNNQVHRIQPGTTIVLIQKN